MNVVQTVQVLSASNVRDVHQAGATTLPSQVYFEFPIPRDLWLANQGADYLGTIAAQIEQQISEGLAVGGSFVQDVDDSGLLADYMDFLVRYVPPDGLRCPFGGIVW